MLIYGTKQGKLKSDLYQIVMAIIDEIKKNRIDKIKRLKETGFDPYPAKTKRTNQIGEILDNFEKFLKLKKDTVLTGRIRSIRRHGALAFLSFEDGSGRIQALFKKDKVGETEYAFLIDNFDIGDFIEISGVFFITQKGEKTIEVSGFKLLAKSLLPLPEKWAGLQDIETRLRKRYLDFIMNPAEKEMFRKKGIFWSSMRAFLEKENFLEVDTPALEAIPGGADAEPFITRHNALDTDFYLRISLELPLKKYIVAGFEKVYEIGKIFRNEGIDAEHLQDYLQLEFYWAYADYTELMDFVEKMYKFVIKKTFGSFETTWKGATIDWGKKWQKIDYYRIFKEKTGLDLTKKEGLKENLCDYALKIGLSPDKNLGAGRLIDLIYKHKVRPDLIQPSFLINPPVEIEPLAKRISNEPFKVERMQVVACATELGKGFSELNDPLDQRARFEEQMKLRAAGDKEAQMIDEDFIEALEYGMPPTAGFGVSERLFAVLMDRPIRETVFLPPMRPK